MTKDNVLFVVCGLLLGFIVGFFFANTVNREAAAPRAASGTAAASNNPQLPPDHPAVPGGAAQNQQALESAADEAARAARDKSEDFEAQMLAARAQYNAGRADDALDFLLRANKLRPDDVEVVVALGNVNYDAGRFEAAERWYTAALLKNPDNVNVRTDLGLTFLLREPPDTARAVAEFRRSLQRDPEHELTLQNLVVALARNKDVKEAQATLERLEKVNPGNETLPKLREELQKARAGYSSPPAGGKG